MRYLNLLREVVLSQFKLRDQSTIFGFLWSFIHPLTVVAVLFMFFHLRLGADIDHYALYLLIGIVHYTHFAAATGAAMLVLGSMRQLACNAILPRDVLILGSVIVHTVDFVLSMLVCILIAAVSGVRVSWTLWLIPVVVLAQTLLALWVSVLLAALFIFVRDTAHLWQVFLRILFLVTPIFYAASAVPEGLAARILTINPLTHLIAVSRAIIIGPGALAVTPLLLLLSMSVLLTGVAMVMFKRYEATLTEHL